jgi:putative salt-induced outer membrane protein YdiY
MNPALLLLGTIAPIATVDSALTTTEARPLATFIAEDAPPPVKEQWTGSVSIGASYQDGNTDTRGVNATAEAVYRGESYRWTASGFWNYGETKNQTTGDSEINARKAGLGLKYDYFLSKKLYAFANGGIETDLLADIKERDFVGGGLGYQWREDDDLKWGSEGGVGYFVEDHYSDDDDEYISARLANNIDWKLNEKSDLANTIAVYPSLESGDDIYGRSDTRFKTMLTDKMFLQIQWIWDWDNTPAEGLSRNDNTVTLGLGWSF